MRSVVHECSADAIIDACEKNKVQLCTIFPSRFGDANLIGQGLR